MQDSILNVNTVYKMKVREKIYRPIVNSIHLFFSPFNSQCKKFKNGNKRRDKCRNVMMYGPVKFLAGILAPETYSLFHVM